MHRPRILFLNRSYWPDVEATGQLLTELCESLQPEFETEVLAGLPNQVSTDADPGWTKTIRHNGVRIHRVQHSQLPKHRMLYKGINYLSFMQATRRQLKSINAPDVVVFETDPFLLPFEAARLHRRSGCRVVGYLQDIYPDVAVALGKVSNNWAIRRLRESLFSIYRQCDAMIVLSEDMRRLLIDGGVAADRVSIVPNWSDSHEISPVNGTNKFRAQHGLEDKFVVMYSGNLGLTQRLEEFLAAADLLKDFPRAVFVFVGQGSQKSVLIELAEQSKLTNVRSLDYQPKSELAHSLSAADLHLVPLTKQLSQCLMPSKLYGILAAGRPYLTNAMPDSELHRLTREHNIGLTVEPGSPQAIAASIRSAASNPVALETMGKNARNLAITEFTRERSVSKFAQMLRNVLRRNDVQVSPRPETSEQQGVSR